MTNTLKYTYSNESTKVSALLTALQDTASMLDIDGNGNNFASLYDITEVTDGSTTDLGDQTTKISIDGGVDEVRVETPHRTIDVAAGVIYAPDTVAGTGEIITFAAVDDLEIYESSFVIVDDSVTAGTYAVRLVTQLPDPADLAYADYYLLGKVQVVPVDATQAKLVIPDNDDPDSVTASMTFTADVAGTEGNNLSVNFQNSGGGGTNVSFFFSANILIINFASGVTFAQLKTAFEATGTNITSQFDLTISGTSTQTLGNVVPNLDGDGPEPLAGGTDATVAGGDPPTPNSTGKIPTVTDTWVSEGTPIETEDYILNLAP